MSTARQAFAYTFLVLLSTLGIGGCVPPAEDDTPEFDEGFEEDLTETYGCGDVLFYAFDEADEVMLSLSAIGLVTAAFDAGEETITEFDLPVEDVTLIVEVGTDISRATCTDVIENEGPVVTESYTAISGTAQITVRPGDENQFDGARGDLHLEDVVFASDDDGETVTLTTFDIDDVSVGWFAG